MNNNVVGTRIIVCTENGELLTVGICTRVDILNSDEFTLTINTYHER